LDKKRLLPVGVGQQLRGGNEALNFFIACPHGLVKRKIPNLIIIVDAGACAREWHMPANGRPGP
jgi:hypothetical protein